MKQYTKPVTAIIGIRINTLMAASGSSGDGSGDGGGSGSDTKPSSDGFTIDTGTSGGSGNASEEACSKEQNPWSVWDEDE